MVEQGELLPCPFCGGDSVSVEPSTNDPDFDGEVFWSVGCSCTAFIGPWANKAEAIAAWNARSTAPVRMAPVLEGELLPVIQDDREAAADMVEDLDRFASGLLRASRIRRGELDDSPEVGAIAAPRLRHYEMGKRDGYGEAVQDLDLATGGDGEYKGSSFGTVDVPAMKARIIERCTDADFERGLEAGAEKVAEMATDLSIRLDRLARLVRTPRRRLAAIREAINALFLSEAAIRNLIPPAKP